MKQKYMKNHVFLGGKINKQIYKKDAASKKDAGVDDQLVFFLFGLITKST